MYMNHQNRNVVSWVDAIHPSSYRDTLKPAVDSVVQQRGGTPLS